MTMVGQPETYSDMLRRIFACTLVTGVVCTGALAFLLPEAKALLDSIALQSDLGPVKGIKAAYVGLPLALAFLSRIAKLHGRISDLFGIRRAIDTKWILCPLAEGAAVRNDGLMPWLRVKGNRKRAMYSVFYPYVSLPDSVIDRQLVRSALDNLGWMWSAVESAAVLLLLSIILCVKTAFLGAVVAGSGMVVVLSVGLAFWFACKKSTGAEVSAILDAPERRNAIRSHFDSLTATLTPSLAATGGTRTRTPMRSSVAEGGLGDDAGVGEIAFDLFISHASEDKDDIARPLYEALRTSGISVWFDEAAIELGDSLRRKIDEGLARCRYGVVILSPNFLKKEWPQRELDGLVARETSTGGKAILPVWHNIDYEDVVKYSPPLADRVAVRTREGIALVVEKIARALRRS